MSSELRVVSVCVFVCPFNSPFNPLRGSDNRRLSQSHSSSVFGGGIVLHFLSSVHSHFLYLPHNCLHTALRTMRVLLVVQVDWKGAETQTMPRAQAEYWRVLLVGREF